MSIDRETPGDRCALIPVAGGGDSARIVPDGVIAITYLRSLDRSVRSTDRASIRIVECLYSRRYPGAMRRFGHSRMTTITIIRWYYLPVLLNERIREARLAAGLTQEALAALAGVGRSLIQDLETPGHDARLNTLRKVAVHLPRLRTLMLALDGADLVERDVAGEALTTIIETAQGLLALYGQPASIPAGAGATRVPRSSAVDIRTERRVAELDAAVDRGEIPTDDEA